MGKLVSIVSNSRKQSDEIALKVQKILKNKRNKVALVHIATGTAPEFTKSPFISSLYDINERYKQHKNIEKKLKTNDYVLIIGYCAETKIREIEKLKNEIEITNYIDWLDAIETVTYSLAPADATFLVSDYPQDTLHELWKIRREEYQLFQTKNSASKIVNNITKIKSHPINTHYKTIYDALCLMSTGIQVDYSYTNNQIRDTGLQELISANKLIAKKLKETNTYIENITRPLGQPIILHNKLQIYPQHTKGMLNLFDSLLDKYHSPNDKYKQVISSPKNEIDLCNLIAENYGMTNNSNLNYTERMRIIETWAMQPNRVILQGIFKFEAITTLSLYDVLILNIHVKPKLSWLPLSPINGYVDCTAPVSVENIVQDTFDKSMVLSATATNNQEQYLLLGHKLQVKIIFNWNDINTLFEKSNLGGSELLSTLVDDIRDHFDEKFPIYSETILKEKSPEGP